MFESLEMRQLLSGGSFSPLYIYGSNSADTITLSQSGYTLTVVQNGVTSNHATYYLAGGSTPYNGMPYGISKVVINGYDGNDTIKADETVQLPLEISGGGGNDSLRGGAKADKIYGGTLGGSEWGNDSIDGGSGNDILTGSLGGAVAIWGGAGNDTLTAAGGSSSLYGGLGNDSLVGKNSNDYLWGEGDDDILTGGWGADYLVGGDGNDQLFGGGLADSLWGGNGDDSLDGEGQADQLNGGAGNDTADYSKRTEDLTITLDNIANDGAAGEKDNVHSDIESVLGGSGNDKITGSTFSNLLVGNNGDDIIHGGSGNDTIKGGWGGDFLYGDAGNDSVLGEGWDDHLFGGAGDDLLDGGVGEDILVDIGGGNHDVLHGGDNDAGVQLDSFWLDSDATETHNATAAEAAAGHVHRISSFANGVSKELSGQDLPDPGLYQPGGDYDYSATYDHTQADRFDNNPLFYFGDPYMKDIKQGALGDCWFLSGIAAIAHQKQDKIKQSIVDLGDGTYAVQFFNGNSKAFYRVDNELPARSYWYGYPVASGIVYAGTGYGGDMWVPIMEKAFALYEGGSYDDLDGGFADEIYDALGLSNTTKDVDDDDALQTVKNALDAGKAVAVNTIWSPGDFESGDTIVVNHVYAVYSVDLANNTITVYNPWGTDTDGTWSQGADDGFITYSFGSFQDYTRDFYIATL